MVIETKIEIIDGLSIVMSEEGCDLGEYAGFVDGLTSRYEFYHQIPPKPHLYNPYCPSCIKKITPDWSHVWECYNKIPF